MKITLIRHTEVDVAYHKCYNGHINIGLSSKGEKQAQALAQEFKKKSFALVYCSDLKRTRDTLSPFTQNRQAIYTQALREKSWGKHEGMTFDAIIQEDEIEYENFLQWINALDGEDYEVYVKRIKEFFLEFLVSKKGEDILVVTHGGVIRVLISLVNKISLEEAFSVDVAYGAYLILDTNSMTFSEVKY
ncbi:alpha-ribazole phosphatase family protein [Sulfurimonas sp. SAG-AH-194-C20]|nr:alpha-ribazole phosphatase family protein [Sulfurimonas sp. SAG-AH-194-C20]MDF1878639.1 alpha-ribazole phosphatase family protein [Sulfurimonas sp. SAG-AH-194-C20]